MRPKTKRLFRLSALSLLSGSCIGIGYLIKKEKIKIITEEVYPLSIEKQHKQQIKETEERYTEWANKRVKVWQDNYNQKDKQYKKLKQEHNNLKTEAQGLQHRLNSCIKGNPITV